MAFALKVRASGVSAVSQPLLSHDCGTSINPEDEQWPGATRQITATRFSFIKRWRMVGLLAILISVLLGTMKLHPPSHRLTTLFSKEPSLPYFDPLAHPGWIDEDGWWAPAAENSSSPRIYQALIDSKDELRSMDRSKVDWVRGKRILFLGDSVIRDIMMRFCFHLGEEGTAEDCHVPRLNLTMHSTMLHGFLNYAEHTNLEDILSTEWPGIHGLNFESRLQVALESMPDPDIVLVNGGAWDFKYMFQRDIWAQKNHPLLNKEDLQVYRIRSIEFFKTIRKTFKTQKLVWVQLHPFSEEDANAKNAWTAGTTWSGRKIASSAGETLPALFTTPRVNQLRQLYRETVSKASFMDTLDYFRLSHNWGVTAFIRPGDAIHPAEHSIRAITDILCWKLWIEANSQKQKRMILSQ